MTEDLIDNKRKKLIFRSWHRGTREMDMLMGSFADSHIQGFDHDQLQKYEVILNISDPELYDWYTGKETPPANDRNDVLDLFLNYNHQGASRN